MSEETTMLDEQNYRVEKSSTGLSRRTLLAGTVTTGLLVATGSVFAKTESTATDKASNPNSSLPAQRTMASTVMLQNGRLMVIGGYDRSPDSKRAGIALSTVLLVDPNIGQWWPGPALNVPRARHAAVALPDGRVVVAGGIGQTPLASVEVFDPKSNRWYLDTALMLPRFDHSAVWDGSQVLIVGGGSAIISTRIEFLNPLVGIQASFQP